MPKPRSDTLCFSNKSIALAIMPFAEIWMDLEITMLSKRDGERQISFEITYMWNLKFETNEFTYKTEIDILR